MFLYKILLYYIHNVNAVDINTDKALGAANGKSGSQ
jgi:hypothetical protein